MPTQTGPDLTPARVAVENLMDDTCLLTRPDLETADVLNPITGEIEHGPAELIYGPGSTGFEGRDLGARCKFKPASEAQPSEREEGGDYQSFRFYNVGLPWDAPDVLEGDIVVCTSSRRDPGLVDRRFIVREIVYSTFLVSRKLVTEHVT